MNKTNVKIDALGERVDYVEYKMGDITEAHNDLVDSPFRDRRKNKTSQTKSSSPGR